jgi:4-amino-4-deoxy-L-arabinose transferase-like glycosyltransferase
VATLGAATVAFSVPWLAVVALVPAGSRPYVGGSTDNSVFDLVFGYNGLDRVQGNGTGGRAGVFGGAGMNGSGGVFGGSPGPLRLVGDAVGGQVAWLVPVVLLALVAGAWQYRSDVVRRAHLALWAGWLGVTAVVFSTAEGIFHSYYVSLLVPGLAGVTGIGLAALVPLVRRSPSWLAAAAATAVATVLLQLVLSGRDPGFYGWTRIPLVVVAGAGLYVVGVGAARGQGPRVVTGLAVVLAALLVTPAAWAASEDANPVLNATLPQAGPRSGTAGHTFGSAGSNGDPRLAAYLRSEHTGETWDLVVASVPSAAGLIADEDVPVMAIGGFMGTDASTDLATIADLVADGQVRLFAAGSGSFLGGTTRADTIMRAVAQVCDPVTVPQTGDTLYDCAGHADDLRSATSP